ncbi:MAG: potassium transporter TrkG, partial [Archaeoglobaceae archaeon]
DTALSIFLLYLFLTILEILILRFLGLNLFDSIVHTFSNISTGGFSTHSESIAYFNNVLVEAIVTIFMILGGTNFGLLYFAFKSNMKIFRNSEFRFYIFLLFSASLILTIINLRNFDFFDSLRYSIFQAVSIMTGTGFTTYDFDRWSDSAKFILLVLMFIGGCSGSTTGGIKVVRILLLIKYSIWRILRAAEPRTLRIVKYDDLAVSEDVLEDVAAFFILYIFLFLISAFIITISGYDLLTSLSASAATLSNVGPGMGLVGASETYADLAVHLKLLLCLNMWIGRLEIFAVLILFTPFYWKESW